MSSSVTIVEIGERSEQGRTQPHHCIGDDGNHYMVKLGSLLSAGWRSLVCEWLAGRLAQMLGLPVAPFAQVEVDADLVNALRGRRPGELVAGPAFGSRWMAHARDLEPSLVRKCPREFRRDLVAFDWWVHNADRSLGEVSGNPNLLWATGRPIVIDHNMAFDLEFDGTDFMSTHVFRADFEEIRWDLLLRASYQQRFTALLPQFPILWSELPHNWTHSEDGTARWQAGDFEAVLLRAGRDDFWQVPALPT